MDYLQAQIEEIDRKLELLRGFTEDEVRAGRGAEWGELRKIPNLPELRDVDTWKRAIRDLENKRSELLYLQEMQNNIRC